MSAERRAPAQSRRTRRTGSVVAALAPVARSPLLPPLLVALIALVDLVLTSTTLGVVPFGLLDWIAHLSTALLILLAVIGWPALAARPAFTTGALIGSVAMDLGHLLLYAHVPGIGLGGRPFSHGIVTPLLLGAAWLISGRRWPLLGGLAVGVVLHLSRDLFTGSGLAAWWPLSRSTVALAYPPYLVLVAVVAVVATIRAMRAGR